MDQYGQAFINANKSTLNDTISKGDGNALSPSSAFKQLGIDYMNKANTTSNVDTYRNNALTPTQYYDLHRRDFSRYGEHLGTAANVRSNLNYSDLNAETQGGWSMAGNSAAQLGGVVIGQVIGMAGAVLKLGDGIGAGVRYIATGKSDFDEVVNGGIGGSIMKAGMDFQAMMREEFPILQTAADMNSFNVTSASWWAANVPSVGSVVASVLIPTAAVKAVSFTGNMLMKGAAKMLSKEVSSHATRGALKYTGKMMHGLGKGISSGIAEKIAYTAIGAHSDVFIEVAHTFNDDVETYMTEGKTRDEAVHLASIKAAQTYVTGIPLGLGSNLLESRLILGKGARFKQADKSITGMVAGRQANAVSKALTPEALAKSEKAILSKMNSHTAASGFGTHVLNMVNEGAEEMRVDFVMNEADRYTRKNNDLPIFDEGTNLLDRVGDFLSEGKSYTSGLFGALGGMTSKLIVGNKSQKSDTQVNNEYIQRVMNGLDKIDGIIANTHTDVARPIGSTHGDYITDTPEGKTVVSPVHEIVQTLLQNIGADGTTHVDRFIKSIADYTDADLDAYFDKTLTDTEKKATRTLLGNISNELEIAKDIRAQTIKEYKNQNVKYKEAKVLYHTALRYSNDYNNRVLDEMHANLRGDVNTVLNEDGMIDRINEHPAYNDYINAVMALTEQQNKYAALQKSIDTDSRMFREVAGPDAEYRKQLTNQMKALTDEITELNKQINTPSNSDAFIALHANRNKLIEQRANLMIEIQGNEAIEGMVAEAKSIASLDKANREKVLFAVTSRVNKLLETSKKAAIAEADKYRDADGHIKPEHVDEFAQVNQLITDIKDKIASTYGMHLSVISEFEKVTATNSEHINFIADGTFDINLETISKAQDEITKIYSRKDFRLQVNNANTLQDLKKLQDSLAIQPWYVKLQQSELSKYNEMLDNKKDLLAITESSNVATVANTTDIVYGSDGNITSATVRPSFNNTKSNIPYTVGSVITVNGVSATIKAFKYNRNESIDVVLESIDGVETTLPITHLSENFDIENINNLLVYINNILAQIKANPSVGYNATNRKAIKSALDAINKVMTNAKSDIGLFNLIKADVSSIRYSISVLDNISAKSLINDAQSTLNRLQRMQEVVTLHDAFESKFKALYGSNEVLFAESLYDLAMVIYDSNLSNSDILRTSTRDNIIPIINLYANELKQSTIATFKTSTPAIDAAEATQIVVTIPDATPVEESTHDENAVETLDASNPIALNSTLVEDSTNIFEQLLDPTLALQFEHLDRTAKNVVSNAIHPTLNVFDLERYIFNLYPNKDVFSNTLLGLINNYRSISSIGRQINANAQAWTDFKANNPVFAKYIESIVANVGLGFADTSYTTEYTEDAYNRMLLYNKAIMDGIRIEPTVFKMLSIANADTLDVMVDVKVYEDDKVVDSQMSIEDLYGLQSEFEVATQVNVKGYGNGFIASMPYKGREVILHKVNYIKSNFVEFVNGNYITPYNTEPFGELLDSLTSATTTLIVAPTAMANINGRNSFTALGELSKLYQLLQAFNYNNNKNNKDTLVDFIKNATIAHNAKNTRSVWESLIAACNTMYNLNERMAAESSNDVAIEDQLSPEFMSTVYEIVKPLFQHNTLHRAPDFQSNTNSQYTPSNMDMRYINDRIHASIDNFVNQHVSRQNMRQSFAKGITKFNVNATSRASLNYADTTDSHSLGTAFNDESMPSDKIPFMYFKTNHTNGALELKSSQSLTVDETNSLSGSIKYRDTTGASNDKFYTVITHPSGLKSAVPMRIGSSSMTKNDPTYKYVEHVFTTIFDNLSVANLVGVPFNNKLVYFNEIVNDLSDIFSTGDGQNGTDSFFDISYSNNILTISYIDSNNGNGAPIGKRLHIEFDANSKATRYSVGNTTANVIWNDISTDNKPASMTDSQYLVEMMFISPSGPNIGNKAHKAVDIHNGKFTNINRDARDNPISKYKTLRDTPTTNSETFTPIHELYAAEVNPNYTPTTYDNLFDYYNKNNHLVTNIKPIVNKDGKIVSYRNNSKFKDTVFLTDRNPTLTNDSFIEAMRTYNNAATGISDFIQGTGEFSKYSYSISNTYSENGKIVDGTADIVAFAKSLNVPTTFTTNSNSSNAVVLTYNSQSNTINYNTSTRVMFNPNVIKDHLYHELLHQAITENVSAEKLEANKKDIINITRQLIAFTEAHGSTSYGKTIKALLDVIFNNAKSHSNLSDTDIAKALFDTNKYQELITYAFTNRVVSDALNHISFAGDIDEKGSSNNLWNRLMDILHKILNISIDSKSILGAIKTMSNNLMSNDNTNHTNTNSGLLNPSHPVAPTLTDMQQPIIEATIVPTNEDTTDIDDRNDDLDSMQLEDVSEEATGDGTLEAQGHSLHTSKSLYLHIQNNISTFKANSITNNIKLC